MGYSKLALLLLQAITEQEPVQRVIYRIRANTKGHRCALGTQKSWWKHQKLLPFYTKKIPKASSTGKLQRPAEPGEKGTLQECCCFEIFILFLCVGCRVLVLESVNLFRKYISFLDVLISCLLPRDALFILTEEETEQAKVRCVAPA